MPIENIVALLSLPEKDMLSDYWQEEKIPLELSERRVLAQPAEKDQDGGEENMFAKDWHIGLF